MASVMAEPPAEAGVATATAERLITADEFAEMALDGPYELIKGRLVPMSRPGDIHGAVCLAIGSLLRPWAKANGQRAYSNDVGVVVEEGPDTVRGPDLAVGPRRPLTGKALREPPTLIVEVLSPSNTRTDVLGKLSQFFAAGVREAWVFDPSTREAEVFRPDRSVRRVLADGSFETEELPGFSATLAECFEDLDG